MAADGLDEDVPRDPIALIETLQDYARAVEYPIEARRTLPGREAAKRFGEAPLQPVTYLEKLGLHTLVRFERDVSAFDGSGCVRGYVAQSFLRDPQGRPALDNEEATWMTSVRHGEDWVPLESFDDPRFGNARLRLASGAAAPRRRVEGEAVICADGIMVQQGWPSGAGIGGLGDDRIRVAFAIDARGKAKPPLTPARRMQDRSPGSNQLWNLVFAAEVDIWAELASMLPDRLDPAVWWKLTELHRAPVSFLPSEILWDKVGVRELATRRIIPMAAIGVAYHSSGSTKVAGSDLHTRLGVHIQSADTDRVIAFSEVGLDGDARVCLRVDRANASPERDRFLAYNAPAAKFAPPLTGALYARTGVRNLRLLLNVAHPLAVHCRSVRHREPVRQFLYELMSADPIAPEHERHRLRDLQRAGALYGKVNWARLDPALRPPYRVYTDGDGWSEITEAQILDWADIKVPDEQPF
jgi:hypothetical protein